MKNLNGLISKLASNVVLAVTSKAVPLAATSKAVLVATFWLQFRSTAHCSTYHENETKRGNYIDLFYEM